MNVNFRRALLVLLAVGAAYTGGWAYFASHHWFTHFPGFGHRWLPQLGPYNEHLAEDAGAMFLALAVLNLFALRHVRNELVCRAAGLTWLVFNVLHAIYHFQHLDMYSSGDVILNIVVLGFAALATAALLIPVRSSRDAQ